MGADPYQFTPMELELAREYLYTARDAVDFGKSIAETSLEVGLTMIGIGTVFKGISILNKVLKGRRVLAPAPAYY